MNVIRKSSSCAFSLFFVTAVVSVATAALGQVSPTEVKNSRAKDDEQKYMPQLVSLQKSIGGANFPFTFRLARYLDAKPGQRAALDSNGLEFVFFQDKVVLKVSGFYRVAYNSLQMTQNGRASQTLQQAVFPILGMIADEIPQTYDYDAIGFEILYDARDSGGSYDYEGREVLTAVFSRDDAFALVRAATDEERQEIVNRSDVFVNGKQFALALVGRDRFDLATTDRSASQPSLKRASFTPAKPVRPSIAANAVSPDVSDAQTVRSVESSSSDFDVAGMQRKLQSEVSAIRGGGAVESDLPETITPSLETSGEQRMLHFTMQNTLSFERDRSSIYKRAAQSFDLFLAPELKDISKRVPADVSVDAVHFSVLNRLGAQNETVEYICPLDSMRAFVESKITTQELINKSIVLVNGIRIGLDLQLVE